MRATRSIATLVLAALVAACIPTDRPTTAHRRTGVEEQKREIAQLRARRVITFEEAARRQFEIERSAYALTTGEMRYWRTAIELSAKVDRREITEAQYLVLRDQAYAQFVPHPPR